MPNEQDQRQAIIQELEKRRIIARLQARSAGHEEPTAWDQAKELGSAGLDTAGRILDEGGGLVRTGLAKTADIATGNDNKYYHEGDLQKALVGNAPRSAELLQRAGLPENAGTSTAGFALDTLTDPLTYLTFGSSAALKAAKLGQELGPKAELLSRLAGKVPGLMTTQEKIASKLTEPVGKAIYKNAKALAEADQKLAEYGKKPISELMLENGSWGRAKSLESDAQNLADQAIQKRNALLESAQASGATLDPNLTFKYAEEKAAKMANSESHDTREAAKLLRERLEEVKSGIPQVQAPAMGPMPGFTTMGAQQLKTDLYQGLGSKAYREGRPINGSQAYIQGEKDIARGVKEAQEKAVDQATGQTGALKDLNEKYGQLVTPQDMLEKGVREEARKPYFGTIDAMSLYHDPKLFLAKKAGDILKSNLGHTAIGQGIYQYGAPSLQVLGQRKLINAVNPSSPWSLLGDTKSNE